MIANIKRPETLDITLTLSESEASVLITLLTEGYDWLPLDHDWFPLVLILSSFTRKTELVMGTGSPYPFVINTGA